jgi:hypothetical protein
MKLQKIFKNFMKYRKYINIFMIEYIYECCNFISLIYVTIFYFI